MNLNLLKTYVKVVETQNLSKTAAEFGLSQPAVTKQIQSLEDTYGVLLLERSGRRLKTTEAGEILYQCAREIIKAMDKTEKAMEEVIDGRKGTLYIGASTIPGQYILPRLLKDFKDCYPSVTLTMDIADTDKVINLVADRVLDLGIVGGWSNIRKIEGFPWLEDELVVVVPADHRLSHAKQVLLPDLITEHWIFREKGSGTRKAVEEMLASCGIKKEDLSISMEAGSTEAVLAAVDSGMGISIVSSWAIKRLTSARIRTLGIAEACSKRHFYVIYPRQKSRRKSVKAFLEYMKKWG